MPRPRAEARAEPGNSRGLWPGRPPLFRAVERCLAWSLLLGPLACAALGLLPWIWRGSAGGFAGPPALLALQVVVLFRLRGRR